MSLKKPVSTQLTLMQAKSSCWRNDADLTSYTGVYGTLTSQEKINFCGTIKIRPRAKIHFL